MLLGALCGIGLRHGRASDAWSDESKSYFAGRLGTLGRNVEGLTAMVQSVVHAPVSIQPFSLKWLTLASQETTKLGGRALGSSSSPSTNCLGRTSMLGQRVADRQSRIEMRVGPLSFASFQKLMPGSNTCAELQAVVRTQLGCGAEAIVRPILKKDEIPRVQLGASSQLGRNAWIQSQPIQADRDDYCFSTSSIHLSSTIESMRRTA